MAHYDGYGAGFAAQTTGQPQQQQTQQQQQAPQQQQQQGSGGASGGVTNGADISTVLERGCGLLSLMY